VFEIEDWCLIEYNKAWEKQKTIVNNIKLNNAISRFVLCEHPSVITIGRATKGNNILMTEEFLNQLGVQVVSIDRGGDVTLHNPEQLVGYPIFNLKKFKTDLHWFLRTIEKAIIETVAEFGIKADRVEGLTGVWVEGKRKICAMGLHCSNWITSHGFALNVNNNLNEFDYIVPCGIKDKEVTSIAQETGTNVAMIDVKRICIEKFKINFSTF
jgi:lipoyl(octanoyl) transferase